MTPSFKSYFFALTCLWCSLLKTDGAGLPPKWGDWQSWGDQGNGTYRNPMLPADYSDLDCIRVGADYYAISSTFQYSPGVVILRSKDLVNWNIAGHAVPDVTQMARRPMRCAPKSGAPSPFICSSPF